MVLDPALVAAELGRRPGLKLIPSVEEIVPRSFASWKSQDVTDLAIQDAMRQAPRESLVPAGKTWLAMLLANARAQNQPLGMWAAGEQAARVLT